MPVPSIRLAAFGLCALFWTLVGGVAAHAGGPIPAPYAYNLPGTMNFGPTTLQHWRRALARVRAGTGDALIATPGESTTAGNGAGIASTSTFALSQRGQSWPTHLCSLIAAWAGACDVQAIMAPGGGGAAGTTTNDPRVTYGAGWNDSSQNSLGGLASSNTTTTNPITISFPTAFNAANCYYVQSGGSGMVNYNLDGGTNTLVNQSGVSAFASMTLSGSLAVHTINIARSSGTAYHVGCIVRNTNIGSVHVVNLGWGGQVASVLATTTFPWSYAAALATFAPDLTIINEGINDAGIANQTAIATYTANIQALITKAQSGGGDVILVIPHPVCTASSCQGGTNYYAAQANQDAVANALIGLAQTDGLPLIDLRFRNSSWAAANTLGLMYDGFHDNALGYSDEAQAINAVLMQQ